MLTFQVCAIASLHHIYPLYEEHVVISLRPSFLALSVGLCVALPALSQRPPVDAPNCKIIDLGDLPGGDYVSHAHGINRSGQVVGFSWGEGNRWEAIVLSKGKMQSIVQPAAGHTATAHAINRYGEAVGSNGPYAFRWRDGQTTLLDDLPGGSVAYAAYGNNDHGDAVGSCVDGIGINSACLWPAGSVVPVRLNAGIYNSVAQDINNIGDTVGQDRQVSPFRDRPVMWRKGEMIELVAAGGTAWAVNDNGVAVGRSELGAFRWEAGVVSILPNGNGPGMYLDEARSINRHNVIVGSAQWGAKGRAARWTAAGVEDLNLLPCVQGTGWELTSATGINDNGAIVGWGLNPQGQSAAFKIKPFVSATAE